MYIVVLAAKRAEGKCCLYLHLHTTSPPAPLLPSLPSPACVGDLIIWTRQAPPPLTNPNPNPSQVEGRCVRGGTTMERHMYCCTEGRRGEAGSPGGRKGKGRQASIYRAAKQTRNHATRAQPPNSAKSLPETPSPRSIDIKIKVTPRLISRR